MKLETWVYFHISTSPETRNVLGNVWLDDINVSHAVMFLVQVLQQRRQNKSNEAQMFFHVQVWHSGSQSTSLHMNLNTGIFWIIQVVVQVDLGTTEELWFFRIKWLKQEIHIFQASGLGLVKDTPAPLVTYDYVHQVLYIYVYNVIYCNVL